MKATSLFNPPLEGGSKKSSVAKIFSGRGVVEALPLPEISFSHSLEVNFDPPSRGG
jgi:hypothetical protein